MGSHSHRDGGDARAFSCRYCIVLRILPVTVSADFSEASAVSAVVTCRLWQGSRQKAVLPKLRQCIIPIHHPQKSVRRPVALHLFPFGLQRSKFSSQRFLLSSSSFTSPIRPGALYIISSSLRLSCPVAVYLQRPVPPPLFALNRLASEHPCQRDLPPSTSV